jgi:hypothetical protein
MIQQEFMSAEPFPHLVLDDFAPTATLCAVAAGFDAVRADAWVRYDDFDASGKRVRTICCRWLRKNEGGL